jgi:hypothetical protein
VEEGLGVKAFSAPRVRLAELAGGILLVVVVAGGYWVKTRPAPEVVGQERR